MAAQCSAQHVPQSFALPTLGPVQSAGLSILLQSKTAQVTLLVPINSGRGGLSASGIMQVAPPDSAACWAWPTWNSCMHCIACECNRP